MLNRCGEFWNEDHRGKGMASQLLRMGGVRFREITAEGSDAGEKDTRLQGKKERLFSSLNGRRQDSRREKHGRRKKGKRMWGAKRRAKERRDQSLERQKAFP